MSLSIHPHPIMAWLAMSCVSCAPPSQARTGTPEGRASIGPRPSAAGERRLILHADDFGMSHSVNRATIEAFEHGWITSASILVPCPWFPEAAKFAREHPQADVGIHLAVNSEWTSLRWGPVAPRDKVASLLDDEGYFPLVETQVVERARPEEIEIELTAQIEKARSAGIHFTHLDSHMGTMFHTPQFFDVLLRLGDKYRMPVRIANVPEFARNKARDPSWLDGMVDLDPSVAPRDWLSAYETKLASLPAGTYQLTVHLGYDDDEMRGATSNHPNWGSAWRQRDFDVVRSGEFRHFLDEQRFALISWRDVAAGTAKR